MEEMHCSPYDHLDLIGVDLGLAAEVRRFLVLFLRVAVRDEQYGAGHTRHRRAVLGGLVVQQVGVHCAANQL